MDRPNAYPFRDAAMRTDPDPLHTSPTAPTTDTTVARASERRVVSDSGMPANAEPPVEERRFSLGATFLGWTVASFFTIAFVAILGAILGGAAFAGGDMVDNGALETIAIGGLIGYLVATFAAYLIGGYAAGRIALWDGVKHGLLTVAWAVLFGLVAVIAATYLDFGMLTANLPLDMANVTVGGVVAALLTLVAMLGGAAWGGAIGERYHDRVHGVERHRTPRTRTRGRPF